ncbi:MAG: tetraacyldisaccharide 4'-kinase [Gammaproteobacteria bacterium]|nr:tetraacyldisaccharide 4'-kinase [Gammaproteobacteria bacterium]
MKSLEYYWYRSNYLVWILLPVAWLYRLIISIRRKLYLFNIKKSFSFQAPVIVVGNIVVGGSGKTPLLIALCEYLQGKGFKPGVVSRGYGGSFTGIKQVTEVSVADVVGDEPLMIFQRTNVPVVVGADRVAAVNYLLSNNRCDIVLSDDGLQHYRMQRDIEIAVVDASRKFGNGFCLPAGPLREPVSRLNDVDLIVYNGMHARGEEECFYTLKFVDVKSLNNSETKKLSSFAQLDMVHSFAGIGNPERFFTQLSQNGINNHPHAFPDHHHYQQEDFSGWDKTCILMTEKDAVKCRHLALPNAWFVRVEAEISAVLEAKLESVLVPLINNHNNK